MPRRRFQRGRLIQRGKNPVWVGVFREDQVQQDGTVKRIQRSVVLGPVRSMSRRSALKAMQPYLDKINSAVMIPPKSGLTLERFVQEWRKTVAPNLRASTVRASESHLRAHILPKLGRLHLNEIDAKTVQSFVTYLAASGRSRKTIENVLLTLSTILRTARTWKYNCGSFSLSERSRVALLTRKWRRSLQRHQNHSAPYSKSLRFSVFALVKLSHFASVTLTSPVRLSKSVRAWTRLHGQFRA
jgi:hypothetical protein